MNDLITRILDLAIAIQQIPAPTFHERARAEFVRARFADEGLADVKMDGAGNVYARLAGCGSEKALVVSAHLDTVFPSSVDLQVERQLERILGPGIGDNSLGVAGLFGLVWALRKRSLTLPGDLWLVANVCEEGLGDLRGIRAVVDHFGSGPPRPGTGTNPPRTGTGTTPPRTGTGTTPPRTGTGTTPPRTGTGTTPPRTGTGTTPLAYIVLEGMALGQITHRGLGVLRTRITIRTSGGHSWIDYGQPSAIHELTALSTRITALELSRPPSPVPRAGTGTTPLEPGLPRGNWDYPAGTGTNAACTPRAGTGTTTPRTTLNIGIISGGSSVNTIAAEAMLELDLRSESAEALEALARKVEQIVHAAKKPGVTVEAEMIGQRPSGELPAEHPLVRLAQDCLRAAGVEPHLNTGSTDANLPLSRGLPSVTIGLTTGGRAHTVHEFINLAPLEKGMEQVTRLVSKVWEVL